MDGAIRSKMKKLAFGVGIYDKENVVNAEIRGQGSNSKYYWTWRRMLLRCYSEEYHKRNPTYINCTVCNEWKYYSVFVAWMETQDHVDRHLDKDVRVLGNKVYSPGTCVFVPSYINTLILDFNRGPYPKGVGKKGNKFVSRITVDGKDIVLGYYYTIKEARDAYIVAKVDKIKYEVYNIKGPQSELIKIGLMKHRAILMDELNLLKIIKI